MIYDNQFLIIGAGPVGYTTALNLTHYGIQFTLFEADTNILDDPQAREAFHDQLRSIVVDRERARAYPRRTAMIEGVDRAAPII